VNITGAPGTVGAYILGSSSPTSVTVETQAGGLQGVMFAVRFATIRLQNTIIGSRINTSDQFTYQIANATTAATITGATTSGTGLGPFSTPALNMSAGMPLTLRQVHRLTSKARRNGEAQALAHQCEDLAAGTVTP
jgi:hypothetical protein